MMYKFIRTGEKPVKDCAGADVIRDCFAPCSAAVKARLNKFLDEGQESITYQMRQLFGFTLKAIKETLPGFYRRPAGDN